MKRFVVPPDWPSPPRRSWTPPKTWRPDPSWPPAPEGWQFWVDGKGDPVRGPIGLYAGPSQRTVFAGAGALVTVVGVLFWALSAVGLFGGNGADDAAQISGSATIPSVSDTPAVPPRVPSLTPTPRPTTTPPPIKVVAKPSKRPTQTKTTTKKPVVRPSTSPRTTKTTQPSRPTTTVPSTRDEILRAYCRERGWPEEWCVPTQNPTNR